MHVYVLKWIQTYYLLWHNMSSPYILAHTSVHLHSTQQFFHSYQQLFVMMNSINNINTGDCDPQPFLWVYAVCTYCLSPFWGVFLTILWTIPPMKMLLSFSRLFRNFNSNSNSCIKDIINYHINMLHNLELSACKEKSMVVLLGWLISGAVCNKQQTSWLGCKTYHF